MFKVPKKLELSFLWLAQTHFSFCKLCKSFFKGFLCQNQVQNVLNGWNIKSLFGCSLGWINIWGHTSAWVTPWYNMLWFLFEESKRVHFRVKFAYVPLTKIIIVFQEVKLLKHEIDLLPKDRRKEEFKHRKENLERDQKRRVRESKIQHQTLQKFHLCNFGPLVLAAQVSPHGSYKDRVWLKP